MKFRAIVQMRLPLFKDLQITDEFDFESSDLKTGALSLVATGKVPSSWIFRNGCYPLLYGRDGHATVCETPS